LKTGDYVVSVGSVDVRWDKCDQVHNLIIVVEDMFMLRVITPVDTDSIKVRIITLF
jgi:hypothetical protein